MGGEPSSKLEQTVEIHADWVLGLAFAPDGQRLFTASRDKNEAAIEIALTSSNVGQSKVQSSLKLAGPVSDKDSDVQLASLEGLVLRFGTGAEALAWGVMFVLLPLSGVFYPTKALPTLMRPLALALPTTHAFTALRSLVDHRGSDWSQLAIAAVGSLAMLGLSMWFLVAMLRTFRKRGYITRYT